MPLINAPLHLVNDIVNLAKAHVHSGHRASHRLILLLTEPYATDFVRHRCRQVSRELCNLLPLLEPDPEAPAAIGPRPRRPTQP